MNEPSIEDLILSGAVEVCGVDPENGELLYNFTNKMKEVMPDLYKEHLNEVNRKIMGLWEMGFVELENMMDEAPIVRLTDKSFDNGLISSLSSEDQMALKEIKRILKVV